VTAGPPATARPPAGDTLTRGSTQLNVVAILVAAAARMGGSAAFVGESAVELGGAGTNVRVLATDLAHAPWGWLQRQARIDADALHPALAEADLRTFPARFPRRLAYSPALRRAVKEEVASAEVVHVHNLWQFPQYAGYRAALDAGVPYVVSPHGALDPYLRQRGRGRKRLTTALWQGEMLRNAALIHVTTTAEERLIADVVPQVPRAVVPCGIRTAEFATLPPGSVFRRRYLGGYDGPLILFLGRITDKKGVDVLVRAFAHARRAERCRLAVVGPDDTGLRPRLRALASELGVGDDVAFIDALYGEDRLGALSAADVWALSSHTENFGIAVVEAMAGGCAVAVSHAVNISEDIAAANAGVVADATPIDFGDALVGMLSDRSGRAALGGRARAFAARYDWSAVVPGLSQMYRTAARRG
jgi:glycosyltransferase involved in cell wall biosynthesis